MLLLPHRASFLDVITAAQIQTQYVPAKPRAWMLTAGMEDGRPSRHDDSGREAWLCMAVLHAMLTGLVGVAQACSC